jgi:hypothetical protein
MYFAKRVPNAILVHHSTLDYIIVSEWMRCKKPSGGSKQ